MSRILLVGVLLAAVACRDRGDSQAHEHEHTGAPRESERAPTAGAANLLRIAPEMLRDIRVTTAPAEGRRRGDGVTALGELRVNEEAYAEIGAPVAARVTRVLAALGDTVTPDQALVELQSIELGTARADFLRARARAQLADQARDRKRALAADRIVPLREVQEAEADAAAAAAELDAARMALRAFGISEADAAAPDGALLTLRAPLAGTVIERRAVPGQMADPAAPLFRVADLTRLWLVVHAFERDALRIPAGSTARITFAALPGRTFQGAVAVVGKQVDLSSRTLPVRIEIGNDDGALRPGMSASAWLPFSDAGEPVVTVPAAALQRAGDQWVVFLPQDDAAFEIRPVGRGRDLGGEVEIVSGLAAGEVVVVDGAFLLKAEAERAGDEGAHHDHH